MTVERLLPDSDAGDLLDLVREIAASGLKPIASEYEAASRFPREQFRLLGRSGLLGLPYPGKGGGSAASGCRRCSRAACSARTRCRRRRPGPTRPRCPPARPQTATTTWSPARR